MKAECTIRADGVEYHVEIEHLHHHLFSRPMYKGFHSHPSYHLIMMSQGDCHVLFENSVPIFLGPKTLLMINPNVPHAFIPNPEYGVEHTSCIWRFRDNRGHYALFPLQALGNSNDTRDYLIRQLTNIEAASYVQQHRLAESYYNEVHGEFKKSVAASLATSNDDRDDNTFEASLNFFKVWLSGYTLIIDRAIPKNHRGTAGETLATQINHLIEMNFCFNEFNISYIAEELGKHPNYLNSVFTRETGSSIGKIIQVRRIEYAKSLLEGTNMKIEEIAKKSGFTRQNYFARTFKMTLGITPNEYRKNYRR